MKNFTLIFLMTLLLSSFIHADGDIGTELRIGIPLFPANLNPVYVTDETSQAVANKIHRALFSFDPGGKLQPDLVQDYRLSRDNKSVEITLKQGVFFANGNTLDARDVAATIKLLKDKRFNYPYASALDFLGPVRIQGKLRLSLAFNEALGSWRNQLTFFILDDAELKDAKAGDFRQRVLWGCGYYRPVKISKPSTIVLELKNPGEHAGMYERIHYMVVPYTRLAPLKLINNELDLCEIQPSHVRAYGKSPSWQKAFAIRKYKKFGYTYLVFNSKDSCLSLDLRKHFYNVLVYGDFLKRFLSGRGEKVITPFLLLNDKIKTHSFPVQPIGKKIRIKLLVNSESKFRRDLALFMKEELKPLGIQLEPVFMEYHSFLECLKQSRFQAALSGFMLDIDYDMKDIFYGGSHFNYAGYANTVMDKLMDEGLKEIDPKRRREIYLKAHDVWLEDLPLLPLFNLYYYIGISREVPVPSRIFELVGSTGDFLFNIEDWQKSLKNMGSL